MVVWRDSLPKTRLRCKTRVPRRPKSRKTCTVLSEAVRSGLAPKARKPFALFVMENSLLKPGAKKHEHQAELKRLGQAWKGLPEDQQAHYKKRSAAEFETQQQTLKSVQLPNVNVSGHDQANSTFWLGPYKVKKSGHNGFSAVAGQGSYGKVFIAHGEDGRLHAVKVFCGRDATAEAKHEVELYQSLQGLRDCDVPKTAGLRLHWAAISMDVHVVRWLDLGALLAVRSAV